MTHAEAIEVAIGKLRFDRDNACYHQSQRDHLALAEKMLRELLPRATMPPGVSLESTGAVITVKDHATQPSVIVIGHRHPSHLARPIDIQLIKFGDLGTGLESVQLHITPREALEAAGHLIDEALQAGDR